MIRFRPDWADFYVFMDLFKLFGEHFVTEKSYNDFSKCSFGCAGVRRGYFL